MANGADGSIIIDTGLDNTGFERGSQRMQQAIRGVTQAINQSGRGGGGGGGGGVVGGGGGGGGL